jgi:hypothetical protein
MMNPDRAAQGWLRQRSAIAIAVVKTIRHLYAVSRNTILVTPFADHSPEADSTILQGSR